MELRYSRHEFSWNRAVGGIARGQVLSSPGPMASKGLPGLNQLFWAMVWEDREFSIQTSGWRRCRGWLLTSCLLILLWTLSWITTGGQPQLLCVPSVWSQRAPQPGAMGGRGQGQPEPSESSQNPLQHPPAGFGECPSPWQQGASPLCLVSGHGYGLRSGVWGVPSQRILGGLAGVGVPTCGPGGLPWTCLPPPPPPDKHGAV